MTCRNRYSNKIATIKNIPSLYFIIITNSNYVVEDQNGQIPEKPKEFVHFTPKFAVLFEGLLFEKNGKNILNYSFFSKLKKY